MSFFERVSAKVGQIQNIAYKSCPKCGEDMILTRWFSCWLCLECDIDIPFTPEEQKKVNKWERQNRLTITGRKK